MFVVATTRPTHNLPKTRLFLYGKPGRIEALYEYPHLEVFRTMLVGYMRVSSDSDRQTTDLHLGRSLTHLLTIVEGLRKKGVAFRSLTEGMDTTTLTVNCCSTSSELWLSMSAR